MNSRNAGRTSSLRRLSLHRLLAILDARRLCRAEVFAIRAAALDRLEAERGISSRLARRSAVVKPNLVAGTGRLARHRGCGLVDIEECPVDRYILPKATAQKLILVLRPFSALVRGEPEVGGAVPTAFRPADWSLTSGRVKDRCRFIPDNAHMDPLESRPGSSRDALQRIPCVGTQKIRSFRLTENP